MAHIAAMQVLVETAGPGSAANVSVIKLLNFMSWLQRHVTALKLAPGETGDQFLDPTCKCNNLRMSGVCNICST